LTGWVPLSKMAPSSTAVTGGTEGPRLKEGRVSLKKPTNAPQRGSGIQGAGGR